MNYDVHYAKDIGEEKTVWPKVGKAFEDKNRIVVKLDSIPLSSKWDGRLFLYPNENQKDE